MFKIYIKKPIRSINITSRLLNYDLDYTVIKNKWHRKFVLKYFVDQYSSKYNNLSNISIDLETGQIKTFWPLLIIQKKTNEKSLYKFISQVLMDQNNWKYFKQTIRSVINFTNQNPKYNFKDNIEKNSKRNKKISKLFKYLENSTVPWN